MKEKITLNVINLFDDIVPIGFIIFGIIGLFVYLAYSNWLVGVIVFIGCLILAAASYGFAVILKAAYVYLWYKEREYKNSLNQ